jgi:hypothetical protein
LSGFTECYGLSPEVGTFLERFSGRVFIPLHKAMSKKDLNRKPAPHIAKPYQQTPDERAAEENVRTRMKKTPRVKACVKEGVVNLILDHPEATGVSC